MSITLKFTPGLPKYFSKRAVVKSVGIGTFIFALFAVGFLLGNATATKTYAEDVQLDSELLSKVRDTVAEKFIFWKSSSTLPTAKEMEYGMISGMVASYKDPYTVFFPPKEAKNFAENVKGSFAGVGMNVGMKDGNIVVIAPLKDSPAMKAGIKAGDIITAVDGKNMLGMQSDEAVSLIRGELDVPVKITVLHQGDKAVTDITIIRKEIKIPTLDTEQKDGVFVIRLYNFSAESPDLFKTALIEFVNSKLRYLVIDLRGNPGGYLEASINMSSYFLKEGQVVVSEKKGKNQDVVNHRSTGITGLPFGIKVVVMVDGGSASASEILAGALKDHGIAKVVGVKSFGKGSVQELVNFEDGSSLKVTVAKWYTPSGVNISEHGIVPDFEVAVATTTPKGYKGTYDAQLLKAIQVVRSVK
ncbi:S41 family peptidase [Candidatus Gracilibacteria bacterium]|nr:S41 family peptidase [Candidatus Gracilibacteria bacterium]MCF7898818.1 S41 family peptidase [Candidatus Paceibacterota bacterium]